MSRKILAAAAVKPDAADEILMRHALALGRLGEGRTRPNPPVGALIVRHGVVLGEGWHRRAGGAHAEIEALKGLTPRDTEGSTLYVTLEPCSTQGRTPPCTQAIIQSGITRVVVSTTDPNPKHAGQGLQLLARHGIDVVHGVCRAEGEDLIAPFSRWVTTGLPYVTLKMGMTLDGRIADFSGKSRWITGPAARREVHDLRRRADAILVGTQTARLDNPSLCWTKRPAQNPKRIVLDAKGSLSLQSKCFTDGQAQNTVVAATSMIAPLRRASIEATGACVWTCGRGAKVNLKQLLSHAGKSGLLHVVCEGGGELAAQLVSQKLVNEFRFYIAPQFLGASGTPVLGGGWPLNDAPQLVFQEVKQVGCDVLIRAFPVVSEKGDEQVGRG